VPTVFDKSYKIEIIGDYTFTVSIGKRPKEFETINIWG
jgi:hypothetical protein